MSSVCTQRYISHTWSSLNCVQTEHRDGGQLLFLWSHKCAGTSSGNSKRQRGTNYVNLTINTGTVHTLSSILIFTLLFPLFCLEITTIAWNHWPPKTGRVFPRRLRLYLWRSYVTLTPLSSVVKVVACSGTRAPCSQWTFVVLLIAFTRLDADICDIIIGVLFKCEPAVRLRPVPDNIRGSLCPPCTY